MKKKIWIDTCNSPQSTMAVAVINKFSNDFEFLVTSRPHTNTEEILRQAGIKFTSIGKHYGKNRLNKTLGLIERSYQLIKFLKHHDIDISFSQSSYYSPIVSFIIGLECIYTNDNEHAKGNIIGYLFADYFVRPSSWKSSLLSEFYKQKTYTYEGAKEQLYIKKTIETHKRKQLERQQKVYYRPGADDAHYYSRSSVDDEIQNLKIFAKFAPLHILCRSDDQVQFYSNYKLDNWTVKKTVYPLNEIAVDCLFFVSSGGTMMREMSLFGIPTFSMYPGPRLSVEKNLRNDIVNLNGLSASAVTNMVNQRLNLRVAKTISGVEEVKDLSKVLDSIFNSLC